MPPGVDDAAIEWGRYTELCATDDAAQPRLLGQAETASAELPGGRRDGVTPTRRGLTRGSDLELIRK